MVSGRPADASPRSRQALIASTGHGRTGPCCAQAAPRPGRDRAVGTPHVATTDQQTHTASRCLATRTPRAFRRPAERPTRYASTGQLGTFSRPKTGDFYAPATTRARCPTEALHGRGCGSDALSRQDRATRVEAAETSGWRRPGLSAGRRPRWADDTGARDVDHLGGELAGTAAAGPQPRTGQRSCSWTLRQRGRSGIPIRRA